MPKAMSRAELSLIHKLSWLRHWADQKDLDFATCDKVAYLMYIEEREARRKGERQ